MQEVIGSTPIFSTDQRHALRRAVFRLERSDEAIMPHAKANAYGMRNGLLG